MSETESVSQASVRRRRAGHQTSQGMKLVKTVMRDLYNDVL
jgi:hypothetical protein